MKDSYKVTKICPYCGKEYVSRIVWTDDGMDWMGHQRGTSGCRGEEYYCPCGVEKKIRDALSELKPMCLNCKFATITSEKKVYCTNPINLQNLKDVAGMFDIKLDKMKVKDSTSRCCNYEFDIQKCDIELEVNDTITLYGSEL